MVEEMNYKAFPKILILLLIVFLSVDLKAQISAPGASGSDKTQYPVFTETDSIYIFCTQESGISAGSLRATTTFSETKTFLWEKYNPSSSVFEFYFSESTSSANSEINNLGDGCYRVTITQGGNTQIYRAWVLNSWYTATAGIENSTCDGFRLVSEHETGELAYYDLSTNAPVLLNKQVKVQWIAESNIVATIADFNVTEPPTKNTDYTFRVYDQYGCQGTALVNYESIVTKASFTVDKSNGEAPLTVTFSNTSENGTTGAYEWFFFRDREEIKKESEGSSAPVDSIMIVAYDDSPVYTYEASGTYMVKLVSKKISSGITCVDTFYLEDYIKADTSFISVPNVFTPNGDGTNDLFVVKFWSMQSIRIDIFNRWGKRIHYWESGDVRGFEQTWTQTVWDGRGMGGRMASPGVYFYNVTGIGRDGVKRHKDGFFHLFRGKD